MCTSANSSDLWSTITEASNAYTRRRLSDFKRLKRSLERSDQQQPIQSDFKDVYTFNDKSSSSSSSSSPTITTTTETSYKAQSFLDSTTTTTLLSSQLYDEQALRLNDFVNERYPMKIKSQQQGNNEEKRKFGPANKFNEYSTNATNGQINAIDERRQTDSSELKSKKATINRLNLIPDGDDAQIIAVTDQQEPNRMGSLLNNANGSSQNKNQAKGEEGANDDNKKLSNEGEDQSKELESDIGIEVGVGVETGVGEQTENHVFQSWPFNYVNERNLNPLYSYSRRQQRHLLKHRATTNHRVSDSDHERIGINEGKKVMKNRVGINGILTRQRRSSISVENRDYTAVQEEEEEREGEEVGEGKTKELITQRGSSTINNEKQWNSRGQKSRGDNLQTNSVANWHPPVIDDLKKEDKMFTSYSKLDSSFTTINSNLNDGQYEKEDERDDNDSYLADEIRGDERTTLSFYHHQPAVAETNIISKTQEKSVAETETTSLLGHQERPVKLNSISYDVAAMKDAANSGHDLLPRNKSQQFLTSDLDIVEEFSTRQAIRASEDIRQPTNNNNNQFSINKWTDITSMDPKGIQVNSISQEGPPTGFETNGQQNTPSGQSSTYISSEPNQPILNRNIESSLDSSTNVNTLDESLMWSAGRYLYMHMKAVASSSMFGVEVGVEWSNERSNGSNVDLNVQDSDVQKPKSWLSSRLHYQKIKSPAPFATIDVISGQNLYLQCTGK